MSFFLKKKFKWWPHDPQSKLTSQLVISPVSEAREIQVRFTAKDTGATVF